MHMLLLFLITVLFAPVLLSHPSSAIPTPSSALPVWPVVRSQTTGPVDALFILATTTKENGTTTATNTKNKGTHVFYDDTVSLSPVSPVVIRLDDETAGKAARDDLRVFGVAVNRTVKHAFEVNVGLPPRLNAAPVNVKGSLAAGSPRRREAMMEGNYNAPQRSFHDMEGVNNNYAESKRKSGDGSRTSNDAETLETETCPKTAPEGPIVVECSFQDAGAKLELGVDESYTLSVPSCEKLAGKEPIRIQAKTVWGVLRGLETLSQLIEHVPGNTLDMISTRKRKDSANNEGISSSSSSSSSSERGWGRFVIRQIPITIEDSPAFAWRGVLVDTARHFIPPSSLMSIIESMASIKLNVLHWHITDADSFALDIEKYNDKLNANGARFGGSAFARETTYWKDTVDGIITFAHDRGVMVVPEIDLPGHSSALAALEEGGGEGKEGVDNHLTARCWSFLIKKHPGPPNWLQWQSMSLNVISSAATDFVRDAISAVSRSFESSPYMHVGSDEVSTDCLMDDPDIAAYIKDHAASGVTAESLWGDFEKATMEMVRDKGKRPIVWQEAFSRGFGLGSDTIVNVWKDHATILEAINAGHDVVNSAGYYLDRQTPTCDGPCPPSAFHWMFIWTWRDMYKMAVDPRSATAREKRADDGKGQLLGGEISAWSESVDAVNIDNRIFQRGTAVAEGFWSGDEATNLGSKGAAEFTYTERRLSEMRCRLLRRGAKLGPIIADFCPSRPMIEAGPPLLTPSAPSNCNVDPDHSMVSKKGAITVVAILGGLVIIEAIIIIGAGRRFGLGSILGALCQTKKTGHEQLVEEPIIDGQA